jgi:hypothetical protein
MLGRDRLARLYWLASTMVQEAVLAAWTYVDAVMFLKSAVEKQLRDNLTMLMVGQGPYA